MGLEADLADALGRKVNLVETGAIRNRYRLASDECDLILLKQSTHPRKARSHITLLLTNHQHPRPTQGHESCQNKQTA